MKRRKKRKIELDIESLPELPEGWSWAPVAELGTQSEQSVLTGPFGSTLGRSDFVTEGVPLLTIGCLTQTGVQLDKAFYITPEKASQLDRYKVKHGDVLFSRSASVGRAGFVTSELAGSVINYHLMRLRLSGSIIDPRMFIYFVRGSQVVRDYLREVNHGATRDGINTTGLLGMPVAIPPANEQQRICDKIDEFLSDLDAGVAALKRVQANLKRYRASVLKAAVEGKLTEAWRAENNPQETGQQLLDRILQERRLQWETDQLAAYEANGKQPPKDWQAKYKEPDLTDELGLPGLPGSWCWTSLDAVGILDRGRSRHRPRNAKHLYGGPYPFVQTGDIRKANTFLHEHSQTYSDAGLEQSRMWPEGTLCITIAANIAETAILGFDGCFPDSVVGMLPASKDTSIRYVEFYIRTLQERLEKLAPATAQKNLNLETLRQVPICVPPIGEQRAIVESVDEFLSMADAADEAVRRGLLRAGRLRQSILKSAFEGKLVAQDPADEPASELLARIKAEQQPKVAKPKPASRPLRVPKKVTQRRGAIAAYTIANSTGKGKKASKSKSLGRTKLAKILYIAQTHEELDLEFTFQRYAAGPFDEAIFKLEGTAKKSDWFDKEDRPSYGVTYHPAAKTDAMCEQATKYLDGRKSSLDRLLRHFQKMDVSQAELFATAYAAWNDLLIDRRKAINATIIEEFYAWDESKQKFTQSAIRRQLAWMRKEGYVPTGKGRRTMPRDKATKLPSRRGRKSNG